MIKINSKISSSVIVMLLREIKWFYYSKNVRVKMLIKPYNNVREDKEKNSYIKI